MTSRRPFVDWRAALLAATPDPVPLARLVTQVDSCSIDRFELGWSAGPRYRSEPPYRWIPYKEAYSPHLVCAILDSWKDLLGPVLDPFTGTGTTLQVAVERGLEAVGVEALEYPRWAANLMLVARSAQADVLRGFGSSWAEAVAGDNNDGLAAAPAASWALSETVTASLLSIRRGLPTRGMSVEGDLAHLALLSIIESVSAAVKDGTSLRRPRASRAAGPSTDPAAVDGAQVRRLFREAVSGMADDLAKLPGPAAPARVVSGDARQLALPDASIGAAVFSPPYPNRYDYSAVYQLELALGGFVTDRQALQQVRGTLLRSHLEAPDPSTAQVADPAVAQVLRSVAAASVNRAISEGRTLRMLIGYFQDMQRVFDELFRVLRPGAPAACVVATQTYFGVAVPTDSLLVSLAQTAGLQLEQVWVLRRKGIPVQQRMRGEVNAVGARESAVLLRKPAV